MLKEYTGKDVIIMTCSNCNTHCKHCYISYEGNFEREKLLDLCSIFKQRYNVLLNGTEILLHPEYFEALQLIGQDFIVTNGVALAKNSRLIEDW